MSLLEPFGAEIWIAPGAEVESLGFRYPTRMAVIRLTDGGLFIWSPVSLSPELRAAVDALGEVRFLVTPTALHYLALPEWKAAYPGAALYGAPGSRARAKQVAFDADLGEDVPPGWAGQIDQAAMRGNRIATEIVFFHRASATLLFADLLQNFPPGWFSGWRALIARMDGMIGPAPRVPQKFRVAFSDRRAARACLEKISAWPAERILMAHGDPVRADARPFLAGAFAWL